MTRWVLKSDCWQLCRKYILWNGQNNLYRTIKDGKFWNVYREGQRSAIHFYSQWAWMMPFTVPLHFSSSTLSQYTPSSLCQTSVMSFCWLIMCVIKVNYLALSDFFSPDLPLVWYNWSITSVKFYDHIQCSMAFSTMMCTIFRTDFLLLPKLELNNI